MDILLIMPFITNSIFCLKRPRLRKFINKNAFGIHIIINMFSSVGQITIICLKNIFLNGPILCFTKLSLYLQKQVNGRWYKSKNAFVNIIMLWQSGLVFFQFCKFSLLFSKYSIP